MVRSLTLLASAAVAATCCAAELDSLPQRIPSERSASALAGSRTWTVEDIVGIRSIDDIAVAANGRRVAFILRQSFPDSGRVRFGLYSLRLDQPSHADKVLESSYLADLSARPDDDLWTLRADLGQGVQLYRVADSGEIRPLVVNARVGLVGTWQGLRAGLDSPHYAGVLSYEWSADGTKLWYATFRLNSPEQQQRERNAGIVYDDRTMTPVSALANPGLLQGTELRVFIPETGSDRLVAYAPTNAGSDLSLFVRKWGTARWERNSRDIRYFLPEIADDAGEVLKGWVVNALDSSAAPVPTPSDEFEGLVELERGQYLTVREQPSARRLLKIDARGEVVRDYGPVSFRAVTGEMWGDSSAVRTVIGTRYADHDGLAALPNAGPVRDLDPGHSEHLSNCDFTPDARLGICTREDVDTAPEIVAVTTDDGQFRTIARPNAALDRIAQLRTVAADWVNRYGHRSDGYVTYPRGYVRDRRYPIVVVTHGNDARKQFASDAFQWEFPVQVLAELGYLVLSVNEARESLVERALLQERLGSAEQSGTQKVQFQIGLDAVATMEAAVQFAVDTLGGDPERVGIAGYSRGAEVVAYSLSQSKVFRAGVTGDGAVAASGYWMSGLTRSLLHAIYGGSPFSADLEVQKSYRAFAPSFRASEFSGPLLQLVTVASLHPALEIDAHLQEASIPAEIVLFPEESHVFWHPQRRVAAMRRTIDWLNYWLLGECDPDQAKHVQYERWRMLERGRSRPAGAAAETKPQVGAMMTSTFLPRLQQQSRPGTDRRARPETSVRASGTAAAHRVAGCRFEPESHPPATRQ